MKIFKTPSRKTSTPLIHESSFIQKIRLSRHALRRRRVLIAYLLVSLFLLMSASLNLPLVNTLRGLIQDGASYLLKTTSHPLTYLGEWKQEAGTFFNTRAKLQNLKHENYLLKNQILQAQATLEENNYLKKLLNIRDGSLQPFLTTRVISYPSHPYFQSILIDAGKNNGVEVDQAALTHEGLVGRVAQVGLMTAQIVLITDIHSRVPVVVGDQKIPAIFVGKNQDLPFLKYYPVKAGIRVGDPVVTSGKGGIFKAGIHVGQVASITEEAIKVQPSVRLEHLPFVSLLPKLLEVV